MEQNRIYCGVCGLTIDRAVTDPISRIIPPNEVAKPCGHLIERHSWQSLALLRKWSREFGDNYHWKQEQGITDSWGRLYCPTCRQEGRSLVVAWYVTDRLTWRHADPHYVDGVYHNHSTNVNVDILCCEYGHKRTKTKMKGCSNCAFGNGETKVVVEMDKELARKQSRLRDTSEDRMRNFIHAGLEKYKEQTKDK